IDLPFEDLRPIAADPYFRRTDAGIGSRRKGRRLELAHFFGRPHVGPNKPAGFTCGIGFVLDPFRNEAVGGLGRHFHDVAFNVEFPAVIEATQAALLVARKYQRRAPVRTVLVENANTALAITKYNEILS